MLILNEKKEVEKILQDVSLTSCKISKIISLLLRYYINNKKYISEDAIKIANDFLSEKYPGFNATKWRSFEENVCKNAAPLREIENIPITQKEIDKINELNTPTLRKIAFAYLVVGKISWISYQHTWVNIGDKEMVVTANSYNSKTIFDNLHILCKLGFLTPSKSILKTGLKVNFIDFDGEPVYNIPHISNLGLWWEQINGAKYKQCVECDVIFKPRNNANIHCKRHEIPSTCKCTVCGRMFDIREGGRSRKRCECCQREYRLKSEAERQRNRYNNQKKK